MSLPKLCLFCPTDGLKTGLTTGLDNKILRPGLENGNINCIQKIKQWRAASAHSNGGCDPE